MPKRLVDGDALWLSNKLRQVQPPSFRAEYANLLPLAEADGTFECDPRQIWARVYAYNREDITPQMVEQILTEFERVGMLERKQNGKLWGKWIGIEKEGRLPAPSIRDRYREGAPEGTFKSRGSHDEVVTRIAAGEHKDSSRRAETDDAPTQSIDPKTLRVIFRQESRKKLTFDDDDWARYQRMCEQYTEERVLQYLREWAQEKKQDFKQYSSYPLKWFLKDLEVMVEGDQRNAENNQPTEEEMRVVQESIAEHERSLQEAVEKAQKETIQLRTHYPDDPFCACPQCQPDFWKETE